MNEPPVPDWPEAGQVERITAAVTGAVSGEPKVPEFEVPPEYVSAVLRALSPPRYHRHPRAAHLQEVGQLRITCRDGRVLEVRLLYSGKEPVLFTLQGVPCIRGGPYTDLAPGMHHYLPEVLTLEGLLRAIKKGDENQARRYLELLDQSAGRATSGRPR